MAAFRIALLLAASSVAFGSDWNFDDTVAAFERHYQVKRVQVPMLGVARFAGAFAFLPLGLKDLQVAMFENVNKTGRPSFDLPKAQPSWRPIVQVAEKSGETVSIFAREEANWFRMFVLTLEDGGDAVLLEFKLRPTKLMEFVARARQ